MTPSERFAADYDVPRGTVERFELYAAMLAEWQARFNLVGPSTLPMVWDRHFADSAQLLPLVERSGGLHWLDMGAGAGFPGLVVALLTDDTVTLVDSVGKKCQFLHAMVEALSLQQRVTVRQARVEALGNLGADVITSRACAPLARLFDWGTTQSQRSTQWLLLKGAQAAAEVDAARAAFAFDATLVPSRTDSAASVIVARGVRRR